MSAATPTINQPAFSSVIRERRSVRSYDPAYVITQEEVKGIIGEAILAPSSSNLQPWRFLVIDSQPLKEKLLPIAYNQKQIVEASAIIAVLGDLESYKNSETIYKRSFEAGYMPEATMITMITNTVKTYSSLPLEKIRSIIHTDGGLVSMQLMLAAKARGYDTVPMGGYDHDKFKEAFGISERYDPVMLIALGKAAKEGHPTTRLAVDEVTSFNDMSFEA